MSHDLVHLSFVFSNHCSLEKRYEVLDIKNLASVLTIMVRSVSLDSISPSIKFHAVTMPLILFIGIPLLILEFIKTKASNKGIYNVSQLAVIVVLISVGADSSYRFSDHISVHAIFGLMVICLLLPRPVLQLGLADYSR